MVATAATISKLEHIYNVLEKSILKYQHPITGLIPATLLKGGPMMALKDAWVRDNVYGIMSAWALALAYRKAYDNDMNVPRADELENVTIKLMQSLLKSMMKQASKVDKFKKSLSCNDALHAKYSYETGATIVGDKEWGHLQLDATSLFLLLLAEMIESGLQIINTLDEVCFIQNLVFYIEKAFKTPDYGVWERGDKTNNGVPELNACSIGMAKAAMEALTDFNLFGSTGGPASLIHVQPDNIQHCNTILESMLPRESLSKEIGSSLLSIIGFPAFSVDNQNLMETTKSEIKTKLEGRYGFKRFLRDGYCTVRSDPNKLHYDLVELEKFENIECEWPLFFAYMCIDGYFSEDLQQADEYFNKLTNSLCMYQGNIPMVPQLYYVAENKVDQEIKNPHSQDRIPGIHIPFMWAQSMYILCMIFHEELLAPADIDPLNRRYKFSVKHSSVIQVALVAKDMNSYELMRQINIPIHSPHDPIVRTILPASELSKIYGYLGRCSKSGLSGRTINTAEILTTSIFYKTDTFTYGFYPQLLDQKHFYLYLDSDLFVKLLTIEIEYLRTNWKLQGRPTIIIPIKEKLLDNKKFPLFMEMIMRFQAGNYMGIRVNMDYIYNHLNTACIVNLKFISSTIVESIVNEANKSTKKPRSNTTTIFDLENLACAQESTRKDSTSIFEISNDLSSHSSSDAYLCSPNDTLNVNNHFEDSLNITKANVNCKYEDLIKDLENSKSFRVKVHAILNLHNMFGGNFEIVLSDSGYHGTVLSLLNDLYQRVCENLLWRYIRSVAAHLNIHMDNLSQACSDIIVREKQLTIGHANATEKVIDKPYSDQQLQDILNECYPDTPIYRLLTQEIIAYISMLIRTSPELFSGMLRIRVGIILNVLLSEFSRNLHLKDEEVMDIFLNIPPTDVIKLLSLILYRKEFILKRDKNKIDIIGNERFKKKSRTKSVMVYLNSEENDADSCTSTHTSDESMGLWYRRRSLDGALNNYYESFFKDVWFILKHSKGISFADYNLSNEIIFEMTPGEMKFALRVETALGAFFEPEYRQLAVEVISVFTSLIKQLNKPIYLDHTFPIDYIIVESNELFLQNQATINGDATCCCTNRKPQNRRCNGYNNICRFFYDSAPSGPYGTMNLIVQNLISYLELNNFLREDDQFHVD